MTFSDESIDGAGTFLSLRGDGIRFPREGGGTGPIARNRWAWRGTLPDNHPFKRVRVQPEVKGAPELWLLGSSDYSGALAAKLGTAFAFAHFINPRGGDAVSKLKAALV